MKRFNITGLCVPHKHYMVDTKEKLDEIMSMIEDGLYFTINRGRQYGKTTTLNLIQNSLSKEYIPILISFEGIGDAPFESQESFCPAFLNLIREELSYLDVPADYANSWSDENIVSFSLLDKHISKMCKDKKIVLMIDEVDKTSNNGVFIHFLGMLRDKYLERDRERGNTFQSVILAGVYDVKSIKLKLINEGNYKPSQAEGKVYNSPWNIATKFEVDMSFSPTEIATMLIDYESEQHTNMDIDVVSQEIYDFTSGYPYLVSDICKTIDEKLEKNWTPLGVQKAISIILKEKNTLFDDLSKNLENSKELYELIYAVLISGDSVTFELMNPTVDWGAMFGFIKEKDGKVIVANRIFEIKITEYFMSKDMMNPNRKVVSGVIRYDVIKNDKFDMELALVKFMEFYGQTFTEKDEKFVEKNARLVFMTYLRPLINGEGFYHMESTLSDDRRMDLVVDYAKEQFIIELKIWRGRQYRIAGLKQLVKYLDSKNTQVGYLLTFDFRKKSDKRGKAEWIEVDGKKIFDVTV